MAMTVDVRVMAMLVDTWRRRADRMEVASGKVSKFDRVAAGTYRDCAQELTNALVNCGFVVAPEGVGRDDRVG